jgi:hypothetical protein
MTRRDVAFLLAAIGAGAEFFGAMFGQGVRGGGLLFGLGGPDTINLATVIGLAAAAISLVMAVRIMFVPDARTAGRVLIGAAIVGTLAAGPIFFATSIPAIAGGLLALRLDATEPLGK